MSPLDYDANLIPAPSLTREFERRLDLGFMVAMDNTITLLLKPSLNAIKLTSLFTKETRVDQSSNPSFLSIPLPQIQPTMDNGQRYGKTVVALSDSATSTQFW